MLRESLEMGDFFRLWKTHGYQQFYLVHQKLEKGMQVNKSQSLSLEKHEVMNDIYKGGKMWKMALLDLQSNWDVCC